MAANGARVATEMKEHIDAMLKTIVNDQFALDYAPGAGDFPHLHWVHLGEHLDQAQRSLTYASNDLEHIIAEMATRGITVESGSIESRLDQAKAKAEG